MIIHTQYRPLRLTARIITNYNRLQTLSHVITATRHTDADNNNPDGSRQSVFMVILQRKRACWNLTMDHRAQEHRWLREFLRYQLSRIHVRTIKKVNYALNFLKTKHSWPWPPEGRSNSSLKIMRIESASPNRIPAATDFPRGFCVRADAEQHSVFGERASQTLSEIIITGKSLMGRQDSFGDSILVEP